MKDHLTLIRMATTKQRKREKCWRGYGEIGTLAHCTVGGRVKDCRCYGTVWQILQKLKIYDPAILLKNLKKGFKKVFKYSC